MKVASVSRSAARTRVVHRQVRTRRPVTVAASFAGGQVGGGLSPELKESIDKFVNSHKVVVFMKGTKQFPQCGFSNTVVQILNTTSVAFETVNILEDDNLRSSMKEYSQWPTFPQVYIEGEFFGGCDIMIESYQNGQLKEALEKASLS